MGNENVNSWLQDLQDTSYIVDSIANQLANVRNACNNLVSKEVEPFVQDKEEKLVKLFSRILYLKLYNDSKITDQNLAAFGGIELWLNVANVNINKANSIRKEISDTTDLLQFSESDLELLCDRCGICGEEKRRFVRATRNLRNYTKKWLEDGREPKDEFAENSLSWISYDRTSSNSNCTQPPPLQRSSPNLERGAEDRRSISESGVDSGASDSGIGSNVSQNSLPTTTPPPSPGLFGVSSLVAVRTTPSRNVWTSKQTSQPTGLTLRGITPPATPSYSSGGGQTVKKSNKSPSTPPPSLKWGTQHQPTTSTQAAASCSTMIRSKSHESNLQTRIVRAESASTPREAVSAANVVNGNSTLRRQNFDLPVSSGVCSSSASAFQLSSLISPDNNPSVCCDISPKSPSSNLASPFSSETLTVPVPKSPRGTGVRMDHKIKHRFKRMWQPSMEHCSHCNKSVGLSGEKCLDCKIRVHTSCKELVGENCGWTPSQMRQIYDHFINFGGPGGPTPSLGKRFETPSSTFPQSFSIGHLSTPFGGGDSASSSSCNSSAPSTPAPGFPQPSPSVTSTTLKTKFTFPDPTLQTSSEFSLPCIHVDESESNELRMSQSSGDATIHGSSHEGSIARLTASDNTYTSSADNADIANSIDSNDSNQSSVGHQWQRDKWTMSTIRGASSSWREWTIPFEDLRFAKPDSLVGRGRFGEVHRAYWHQDVAVKMLNMDHVENDRQLETFKREVSMFRNTRHENIVLFVGCCLNPPRLGIVMNLCKGRTLYTYIHSRRDRLDMNKIISLAIQVSQGMSYLHGKKIIHKDLRTKNVFIENNNKAVITDFSLFSVRRLCRTQTPTSEVKGLHVPEHWLCYLAPEIMKKLKFCRTAVEMEEPTFTEMSDVYAFGTVWYEMLTYEFPYKRQPTEAVVWQCGRGIKPALNNLPVAKEIKDILMQCWAYNDLERSDFNQLLKTFEKLPRKRLERSPSQPVHLSRSAESVF